MRILITGNLGYLGPVIGAGLRRALPGAWIEGVDPGFFAAATVRPDATPERYLDRQRFQDIRDVVATDLGGFDAIVHLAALSNDPIGREFADATAAINRDGTIALAQWARDAGVERFVFASSCSVYGAAGAEARTEDDPLNPLTQYARSKVAAEEALAGLARPGFVVTSLRFATACGWSPRLRLDLVLNDFVVSALTTGRILILSDGTPWRPLIDARDMARAVEWGLTRRPDDHHVVVNAGANEWNFRIADLAERVAAVIPGTEVDLAAHAEPDRRTYRVDFSKYRALAPDHYPTGTVDDSIGRIVSNLAGAPVDLADFRNSGFIRLGLLRMLRKAGELTPDVRWRS